MNSKYLSLGAQLAQKASTITEAQKKEIEALEKQIASLNSTMDMAQMAIQKDLDAKKLTHAQAECELAIAKAQIKASIEATEARIKEINPLWVSNLQEQAKVIAQNTAVQGLELIGKGLGFLGRAVNTAKMSAVKVQSAGTFQKVERPNIVDQLQQ